MSTVAPMLTVSRETAAVSAPAPSFVGNIWRAPLVPVALAATAGIVADRYLGVPLAVSLITATVCLAFWAISRTDRRPALPLAYLFGAVAALAATYHHWHREFYPPDDIGNFAL